MDVASNITRLLAVQQRYLYLVSIVTRLENMAEGQISIAPKLTVSMSHSYCIMLSSIACIGTTTQQGHCKCSPCKSIVNHTKGKIHIEFINKSLNCISIQLSFETLQTSRFNTLGEGFSLILGYSPFCCKPNLHLCLHGFYQL